jgi:transposase-like protein
MGDEMNQPKRIDPELKKAILHRYLNQHQPQAEIAQALGVPAGIVAAVLDCKA